MSHLYLSLALFAVSLLLTTCIHGVHVEPNDIVKTIEVMALFLLMFCFQGLGDKVMDVVQLTSMQRYIFVC